MTPRALRSRVLARLASLRAGTTICAGRLARDVLPGEDRPLAALRPTLGAMERSGEVVLFQRGVRVRAAEVRGPFRVAGAPGPAGSTS